MHVVMVGAKPQTMRALVSAGHEVTVLYEGWEEARILTLRDAARRTCAVDSMRSVESLWSALHQVGALQAGVDVVVATSEACVVSCAVLGELLGARALPPEVALRCRDKAVQKAAWQRAGVPCARFVVVPDVALLTERELIEVVEAAGLQPPFFVKPTAGYGSRRVLEVDDLGDVGCLVISLARQHPELRRLLIEEKVAGDEWHFDGVLRDGELGEFCVSRYVTPVFRTKLGDPVASIAFPPAAHGELYRAASALAVRAAHALGHQHGVLHLEAFSQPGSLEFVAGELAARPGGNASSEVVLRTVGVDPWEAAALTLTGDQLPRHAVVLGKSLGVLSLPASRGRPNLVGAGQLTSLAGVREVSCMLPYGDRMPDMLESSSSCIGVALVEGNDFSDCRRVIERVIARVHALNNALEKPAILAT